MTDHDEQAAAHALVVQYIKATTLDYFCETNKLNHMAIEDRRARKLALFKHWGLRGATLMDDTTRAQLEQEWNRPDEYTRYGNGPIAVFATRAIPLLFSALEDAEREREEANSECAALGRALENVINQYPCGGNAVVRRAETVLCNPKAAGAQLLTELATLQAEVARLQEVSAKAVACYRLTDEHAWKIDQVGDIDDHAIADLLELLKKQALAGEP